ALVDIKPDVLVTGMSKLKQAIYARGMGLGTTRPLRASGFTAREANRLLDRTGMRFWQRESYDHWIRDAREFDRVRAYIENNPVKAGLATAAENYVWSSARKASKNAGLPDW